MTKFIDYSQETPKLDPSITASVAIGEWDDDVAIVVQKDEQVLCTSAWTGWYRHPRGGVYKICKDRDGYLVHKPGGSIDAWGTGYTWRDVKSGYGLAGVRAYQSRCGGGCR